MYKKRPKKEDENNQDNQSDVKSILKKETGFKRKQRTEQSNGKFKKRKQ